MTADQTITMIISDYARLTLRGRAMDLRTIFLFAFFATFEAGNGAVAQPVPADDANALFKAEAKVFDDLKGRVAPGAKRSGKGKSEPTQYRSLTTFGADNEIQAIAPPDSTLPKVDRRQTESASKSLESRTLVSPATAPGAESGQPTIEVRRFDYEFGKSYTTVIDTQKAEAVRVEENTTSAAPLSKAEISRALSIARAGNPAIDNIARTAGEGNFGIVALLQKSTGAQQARRVALWIDRPKLSPRVVVDLTTERIVPAGY